jgi:hypothetical protein
VLGVKGGWGKFFGRYLNVRNLMRAKGLGRVGIRVRSSKFNGVGLSDPRHRRYPRSLACSNSELRIPNSALGPRSDFGSNARTVLQYAGASPFFHGGFP